MSQRKNGRAGTVQRRKLSEYRQQRGEDTSIEQDDWDLSLAYGRPWTDLDYRLQEEVLVEDSDKYAQEYSQDNLATVEDSLWPLQQVIEEVLDGGYILLDTWPGEAAAAAAALSHLSAADTDPDPDGEPPFSSPACSASRLSAAVAWANTLQTDPASLARALRANPTEAEAERRLRSKHCAPPKATPSWASISPEALMENRRWRLAWTLAVISHPMWVRPLSAWKGGSRADLLRCLLVEQEPRTSVWNWLTDDCDADMKLALRALVCFVCQAQAISLRRVANALAWPLSPAAVKAVEAIDTHELENAIGDQYYEYWQGEQNTFVGDPTVRRRPLSTRMLMLAATVRLAGGGARETAWLYKNPIGAPFELAMLPATEGATAEATRWLVQHADTLPLQAAGDAQERDAQRDDDVCCILRWAEHEQLEAARRGDSAFTWRGRAAFSALRAAREYQQFVQGAYDGRRVTWEPYGWDWQRADEHPSGTTWCFVERLSSEQLADEGAAQMHCVRGYASRCVMGASAIVTLLHGQKRIATIEVDPRKLRLVQVRGKHNARVGPVVAAVVTEWAQAKGLQCSEQNTW